MIKASDYVVRKIEQAGVKHVFMITGGGAMHLNDSFGSSTELDYVCCLHEQACAIAAEAYARVTNNIGVCVVTTGPGGTNTITGVAAAWIESTPTIFISGQVKLADQIANQNIRQMGMQEVDIISIVKPITKYAIMVTDAKELRYHMEKALHLVKSGRPGPVWIDIPLDIQAELIDPDDLPGYEPEIYEHPVQDCIFEQITEALAKAERPVLLAGNGIRLSGAVEDFLALAEELNIPVLTTWNGIDLIEEDHPLYMGRPGGVGQRGANFIQQNSDLFISIGARLNLLQTGFNHENFARAAVKVMVDIDENELKKINVHPDIPVCMDAGDFIRNLRKRLNGLRPGDCSAWIECCRAWKEKYPVVQPEYKNEKNFVNSYLLLDEISRQMKPEDVYVSGSSGSCIDVSMQTFKVKKGQRVFSTKGLASMGFGLPASIGACLASGNKRTVCVNGDGGIQMNIQEFETLRRLNLPVKIFVLDNGGYATIKATQNGFFKGHLTGCEESSNLTLPDITHIATAYNLKTLRIERNDELAEKVAEALDYGGPVIVNVSVSADQPIVPRQCSYQNKDSKMESLPLEYMKPQLSTEEMKENMIIGLLDENL